MSRSEKIQWLRQTHPLSERTLKLLDSHLHGEPELQSVYADISENNITNFYLPLGLAPNFLVNGRLLTVPMVIEESSVVAAASYAARFWAMNGGFRAEVVDVLKAGQVHFTREGDSEELFGIFDSIRPELLRSVEHLTSKMVQRGGGIDSMEIRPAGEDLPDTYQILVTFRTADAMGANFINTVLEALAESFSSLMKERGPVEIIMSILSNYTPECRVRCSVEAPAEALGPVSADLGGITFARKFVRAVEIAGADTFRAVTHNKGIFNGMDAVILATGNDFRAVEACGHAYAARDGTYRSLSGAELTDGMFRFSMEVPLAVGTVGGLTRSHPMAAASMEILGGPDSAQLMEVIAAAGLANNFSAVRSLVTTGIQKGHMKMHLGNILRQLGATPGETRKAMAYFSERTVSHSGVESYLRSLRENPASG